jgi:hypothetical protein
MPEESIFLGALGTDNIVLLVRFYFQYDFFSAVADE